jgi:HAD superfamily hydrolase (TIGR01509 family)
MYGIFSPQLPSNVMHPLSKELSETIAIRAILFDLDGLMVDSEPHSLASWQAVLRTSDVTLSQEIINCMFGRRLIDAARMLAKIYALGDSPEILAREKEEYQINHLAGQVRPMPGLGELLDEVDRRSLPKAVASSGVQRYVSAVLGEVGLTERFHTIVTGDEVESGKPAPDIFLAAARALSIAPQRCLVLEDASAGVQAAKAAEMRCVAIPNVHTQMLDLSLADWVLPSLIAVCGKLPILLAE